MSGTGSVVTGPGRDRDRPDGIEQLGLPQILRRSCASGRSVRAHRSYDRMMDDAP
jgi:hypothetical protein